MKEKTLTEKLLEKSDKTYKKFLKKIIPEINENSIIGVRMNEIRKIEKNSAETELSEFKKIKHEYLEEKLLHAINISKTKMKLHLNVMKNKSINATKRVRNIVNLLKFKDNSICFVYTV